MNREIFDIAVGILGGHSDVIGANQRSLAVHVIATELDGDTLSKIERLTLIAFSQEDGLFSPDMLEALLAAGILYRTCAYGISGYLSASPLALAILDIARRNGRYVSLSNTEKVDAL